MRKRAHLAQYEGRKTHISKALIFHLASIFMRCKEKTEETS